MTASPRYEHTGLVLARITTDPGDLDPPTHLNPADPTAIEQNGRAWLEKVWARPEVRDALELASPVLSRRLDQILGDAPAACSAKELRRALVSVASYVLRWQRRATPFGLFAGVGVADIGPATAEVGTQHRAMARVDGEWLTTLIDQLERHTDLRPRLTLIVDDARTVRDGRVIVHRRAEIGAAIPGPLRESSVRLTRPVQFVLSAATSPIRFDSLADQLGDRFPSASPDKIHALLHGLIDAGLLITSLRPPMTSADALAHLVSALRAAGVDALDDVAEGADDLATCLHALDAISADLVRHNHTNDSDQARAIRAGLASRMAALIPATGPALAADVHLDARITIPERVLREAARAASVLMRTSTQPFGSAAWLDYHARFRARYGPGALVPVRELVADSGLGYPAGYLGAPRARPAWRVLSDRDAALLALIQQSIVTGAKDIELTDADVEALTIGEQADAIAPQRIELGVEVHAPSTKAIDRGEFGLRVSAAPHGHTSMAGRFAYLLDQDDHARLAATYAAAPAQSPPNQDVSDAVAVQLSFPPRRPHNENVVRVPPLLGDVVSLSEHPDPTRPDLTIMGMDDLAVTADAEQMYLVQVSTGRRVIPRIPHALDTAVQSPPLARFLAEVADARSAVFRGFDLGAARVLPYVPRIRYQRTVLFAARWVLTDTELPAHAVEEGLRHWRQRWRLPARVVLVHGELRLPVDLDQELDRALLRGHLERTGRVELHEDGQHEGQGWIGRPAELLIPMTEITPPPRPLPATAAPAAVLRPGGSAVVHAQLVGNPARFDELLTAHLPRFIAELVDLDRAVMSWWARRHRDMIRPETDQHLAMFLRLTSPEHYGPVAARLAVFAADLDSRGLPGQLTFAPTPQHPARYGDGPALTAAEQVFATDTTAAIAQLAAARESGIPAQALAAASMAHLAASFAPDPQTGHQALLGCLRQEHGPLDRALRDHALAVAAPSQGYRAVRAIPGGGAVAAAWRARDIALSAYHRALSQQDREPSTVLRTLLHEHHIRAVGVDPRFENETGRLARAIALRSLALAGAR